MKSNTTKRTVRKPRKIAPRRKTTRVTVDFPSHEHRRLKAVASLEGVTLQEYIRSHIMDKVNEDIPSDQFQNLMNKIFNENEEILKRLADK